MPYLDEVKERAYSIDPECWVSYSGQPVKIKRGMDERRTKALEQAQVEHDRQEEAVAARVRLVEAHFGAKDEPKEPERWDLTNMPWEQMSGVVRALWDETKRRNPIGVNCHRPAFFALMKELDGIAEAEKMNPSCDVGPTLPDVTKARASLVESDTSTWSQPPRLCTAMDDDEDDEDDEDDLSAKPDSSKQPQPQLFIQPQLKELLDNQSLQIVLALTLSKLAELCHKLPYADDYTEQFMDIRDNIAWRD